MQYQQLGQTDLKISKLSLGTMTFGQQNSEAEAHEQLDCAIDAGINLIDTAEMYPIPPMAQTQGKTETYIGSWLKSRGRRDRIIIATKVSGPADWLSYLRDGNLALDRANIEAAIDESLRRLRTDVIDIYQLHWPDRDTNRFGQLGYKHHAMDNSVAIIETLQILSDQIKAGKIRYIGVSNETSWGVMQYIKLSEFKGLPRIVSIQNPYNLLNRTFEIGLAEIAHREQVRILAYSPMAFGVLSGKYLGNRQPKGARLTLFERFVRYSNPEAERATHGYVELARRYGLEPSRMALAFVTSRPFVISNIIGATSLTQLESNLKSLELVLSPELLDEIDAIHQRQPNPSP